MNKFNNIEVRFSDLGERDKLGETEITQQIDRLTKIQKSGDSTVSARLAALQKLQARKHFDPVVQVARRDIFGAAPPVVTAGRVVDQGKPRNVETDAELQLFAVIGLLIDDGVRDIDPERGLNLAGDKRFRRSLAAARGEFKARQELFEKVYDALVTEAVVTDDQGRQTSELKAVDLARVVRELDERGIAPDDGYLPIYARAVLADQVGGSSEAVPSTIQIDLPELETEVDVEIVVDNLDAMQAIYFAATLEDLKLFAVMEKLVELFHQGMLPLGKGNAGNQLYGFWKKSTDRMTEVERRNLYARAFGFPGGDSTTGSPNRDFQDLWYRFVSAVSEYNRQGTVEQLLRDRVPYVISAEQVRKAGRDLAANLSLYGYGVAYFAATELQTQIREILAVFGDDEVRSAYGARDVWQVIDQVATLELGGARNSVRQRTMATAGATIIRWLARNIDKLTSIGHGIFLDPTPNPFDPRHKPMSNPTDRDLIDACEQWLAVTGTSDQRVEEYSQPVEGPNMPSRPIQIPAVARDLLDSVGVSAPLQVVR